MPDGKNRTAGALVSSEHEKAVLLDSVSELIMFQDRELRIQWVNRTAANATGKGVTELCGRYCFEVWQSRTEPCQDCPVQKAMLDGTPQWSEKKTPDGRAWWVNASPVRNDLGQIVGAVEVIHDITERIRDEERRQRMVDRAMQSQKLESLGLLAGGIAHDFNNLLVGILGNADLALMDLELQHPARINVIDIRDSAMRAAELAQQMLAYAGKGRLDPAPIQLSTLLGEIRELILASAGDKIKVEFDLAESLPQVLADSHMLHQLILHLTSNAAEAIGDRIGHIVIRTGRQFCDRACIEASGFDEAQAEGEYVYLEVDDDGCGLNAKVRQKMFEPFFSTKFTGRGLGLSVVLGVVRRHKGLIQVDGQLGKGTVFRVLLPALVQPVVQPEPLPEQADSKEEKNLILVVDDEEIVREVAVRVLRRSGYQVLVASNGLQGIELFRSNQDQTALVLLDWTMPDLDGGEVLKQLKEICADVKIVLTSGYGQQEMHDRFSGNQPSAFLEKPFTASGLIEQVRKTLQSDP